MKHSSFLIISCLFILGATSCGILNKSNAFGIHLGKNKVIDRDFEAQVDFEEEHKTFELQDYQVTELRTASNIKNESQENQTEPTRTASNQNNFEADAIAEAKTRVNKVSLNIKSLKVINTQYTNNASQDSKDPVKRENLAFIMFLILGAFILVFAISFFTLFEYWF